VKPEELDAHVKWKSQTAAAATSSSAWGHP
jgi:hypothetical protein